MSMYMYIAYKVTFVLLQCKVAEPGLTSGKIEVMVQEVCSLGQTKAGNNGLYKLTGGHSNSGMSNH